MLVVLARIAFIPIKRRGFSKINLGCTLWKYTMRSKFIRIQLGSPKDQGVYEKIFITD